MDCETFYPLPTILLMSIEPIPEFSGRLSRRNYQEYAVWREREMTDRSRNLCGTFFALRDPFSLRFEDTAE